MAHHRRWIDSLCRGIVVCASCCMNMVVSRVPVLIRKMDPAEEVERFDVAIGGGNDDILVEDAVFGASRIGHRILAGGQRNRFPVVTVDLVVEKEIRSHPL